jgi:DNA gyrase subunit A
VFELRKARERGHVLEGLAVALANIDAFIETIKTSPTPPSAKLALMAKVGRAMVGDASRARQRAVLGRDAYPPESLPPFGCRTTACTGLDAQAARSCRCAAAPDGLEQDKILASTAR